jgi:hypothetical protein
MAKKFYDVTVEYTGTKTFRVYMQDGEPAAALGVIAENFYEMERNYNPIDEREEMVLTSIVYGEQK